MTHAEVHAKWQADKIAKDKLVEEMKAKMLPFDPRAVFDMCGREDRQVRLRRKQERIALHQLQSKPLTPPIQWKGFILDELSSICQMHTSFVCVHQQDSFICTLGEASCGTLHSSCFLTNC